MADTAPFIRAILDRPDDDAPRLVLADFLEERGSAQGEFIRIQCELARLDPTDHKVRRLWEREAELLRQHRQDWLRPLHTLLKPERHHPGLPLQHAEFRRGLVEAIRVEASAFLAHSEDLMLLGPVRDLCLVGMVENLRSATGLMTGLARLDCWDRVEVLGLRLWHWPASVVDRFLAAVELPRLRELRLYGDAIGIAVVGRLLGWPALPRVRVSLRSPDEAARARIVNSPYRSRFD